MLKWQLPSLDIKFDSNEMPGILKENFIILIVKFLDVMRVYELL